MSEQSSQSKQQEDPLAICKEAVLVVSEEMPEDAKEVSGYDLNQGLDYDALLKSYVHTGFQATNLGLAVETVKDMLDWRPSPEDGEAKGKDKQSTSSKSPSTAVSSQERCTIFFGYTSNMISCGMREYIRYLCQHKLVDVVVTTGGGIEEDIMKCLAPHYMGDFKLRGKDLRLKGLNRIGNLIVPNKNYCKFEDFMMPVLDKMLEEQMEGQVVWTPSKIVRRLGEEIDDPRSVYYWCARNDIPVYCPAITDGSVGDMIYFHSYQHGKKQQLIVDLVGDIRELNMRATFAQRSGMLILGGGLVKHHICNANLMRNGADYTVFINTGQEFDGSDAGAKPEEAISWGKIKIGGKAVKVSSDASLVFPLLVAQAFVPEVEKRKLEESKKSAKQESSKD